MTAYGSYHLPEDTDPVQTVLDRLESEGLEVLASERNALSAVAVMGHLSALEHLIHRAMLVGSPQGQAATVRQWVRDQRATSLPHEDEHATRPAKHRAVFMAAENHPEPPRWKVSDDGASFHHFACDQTHPGGIDRADTGDKAAAHHHECEAVRDV